MSKEKLMALLEAKKTKKATLVTRSQESKDVNEVRSIATDIEGINEEIAELRGIVDAMPDDHDENWQDPEKRSAGEGAQVAGGFNPVATFTPGQAENRSDEDVHSSLEYREAFKNYIVSGTAIPDKFTQTEERADALSTVGDIGAVIPTTIMNKVIEDMTVEGKILARITQTAFQGGLSIPLADINPEATWLANEETVSDEQKEKMDAKITFGYHVLEAKVAIGLLTATVSLPVFENIVVKQLKKAMVKAIETSIVKGTGSGQPKGFLKYELPDKQVITMTASEISTVSKWAEVEAAIPEEVEDTVIHMMAKPTWEKYLNGMTDKNGQKIGLAKINEKGQRILNGKEVLLTDKLPSFDAAQEGDIFALEIDLSQYLLNSNLAMYYKKYYNEDKNKWIHKCLMIADGQMCIGKTTDGKTVGAQSLIYIKKGAAV